MTICSLDIRAASTCKLVPRIQDARELWQVDASQKRQILLNSDGSSVVKAFDAAKAVWNVVKEIRLR